MQLNLALSLSQFWLYCGTLAANAKTSKYFGIDNAKGDYYIHNSKFMNLTDRAIYISSNSNITKLLISQCSFTNCSYSSLYGGSIFFGTEGQCLLSKVCATQSLNQGTGNGAVFSYQKVTDNSNFKNEIEFSTIHNCGITTDGNDMLYLIRGNITITNTNESQNHVYIDPFYQIEASSISQVNYCQLENSTTVYHTLTYNYAKGSMNFCNIFNCQLSNTEGLLFFYISTIVLNNCAIMNNKGTPYFYLSGASTVSLRICSIDSMTFTTLGDMKNKYTTNEMGSSTFTNELFLFDYQICQDSDFYDSDTSECQTYAYRSIYSSNFMSNIFYFYITL